MKTIKKLVNPVGKLMPDIKKGSTKKSGKLIVSGDCSFLYLKGYFLLVFFSCEVIY